MALRTAEKGLFGGPYTGQINGWSIAQITFRTVSQTGFSEIELCPVWSFAYCAVGSYTGHSFSYS